MEDSSLGCEKRLFLHGNLKELDSTLKEMDDLVLTRTSLKLINKFKKRMTSQFEMSDLGELTYYLGIEVSQEKDCGKIKQERYVMKILKEAGLEDCNTTLCPMEPGLKLSKAKVEHPISKGAEFMEATAAVYQAIWLKELLAEVTGLERQKVIIKVDNKSEIALSMNPIFHGRGKHIHTRYNFIHECVENELVIVEHVSEENQRANSLTKALARIRFKEMRSLLGLQELPPST
ncbi:zinc finger, CCHC-type containing protein [Tanacetum coccineum]